MGFNRTCGYHSGKSFQGSQERNIRRSTSKNSRLFIKSFRTQNHTILYAPFSGVKDQTMHAWQTEFYKSCPWKILKFIHLKWFRFMLLIAKQG